MKDLIERQAAIEALGEEPLVWDDNDTYEVGILNQWKWDVEAIKKVPSTQAEQRTGKWILNVIDGVMGHRSKAWVCNQCNMISLYKTNYCPECESFNKEIKE